MTNKPCETAVYLSPNIPSVPASLFLIAGSGRYPALLIEGARRAGVQDINLAAFENETDPATAALADTVKWLRVGQLGGLLIAAKYSGATAAIMAGQIAPKNLFDLRPDLKALILLARLKRRNAETLFGEIAKQLDNIGVSLLPATMFMDDHLATEGHIAGPRLKSRVLEDIAFGFSIARETSRMDIGQSVVVKNGTVLAVEAFEGTDECIRRGGELGRGGAILVKMSKPDQDMRFDVPVVGSRTLDNCKAAGVSVIAVEVGRTLLLDRPALRRQAETLGITIVGA